MSIGSRHLKIKDEKKATKQINQITLNEVRSKKSKFAQNIKKDFEKDFESILPELIASGYIYIIDLPKNLWYTETIQGSGIMAQTEKSLTQCQIRIVKGTPLKTMLILQCIFGLNKSDLNDPDLKIYITGYNLIIPEALNISQIEPYEILKSSSINITGDQISKPLTEKQLDMFCYYLKEGEVNINNIGIPAVGD